MRREIIVLLVLIIVIAVGIVWWTNSGPEDSKPKCPNECTYGCITMTSRCREPPCPSNCTLGCIQGTIQCKPPVNTSNLSNISVTSKLERIKACGAVSENSTLDSNIYSEGSCLLFSRDDVTLDCNNKLILGNNNPNSYGIRLVGRKNITIKNCIVMNYSSGIMVDSSSDISILNSAIRESIDAGIVVNSSRSILIYKSSLLENAVGIWLESSHNTTLSSNMIHYNKDGIKIEYSDYIRILNNSACSSTYYDMECESADIAADAGNVCKLVNGCSMMCSKCPVEIQSGINDTHSP